MTSWCVPCIHAMRCVRLCPLPLLAAKDRFRDHRFLCILSSACHVLSCRLLAQRAVVPDCFVSRQGLCTVLGLGPPESFGALCACSYWCANWVLQGGHCRFQPASCGPSSLVTSGLLCKTAGVICTHTRSFNSIKKDCYQWGPKNSTRFFLSSSAA